ncbi:MAG TPA: RICIN domain-containing protein [Trebonia sp.]|nr:RICIN domain-containing protein [Trebonia sp.]
MAERCRWQDGMRMARAGGALAAVVVGALAAVLVAPTSPASADTVSAPTQTVSFTTVGEHAFAVPLGLTSIHVVAIGGAGGSGYVPGGLGARVEADVRVSPGSTIYAEVGGNGASTDLRQNEIAAGGANGGESGGAWQTDGWAQQLGVLPDSGAGGGGASDLQTCPVASCQPIDAGSGALLLVAGGGGGAGAQSQGGDGGTPTGGNAIPGTGDPLANMEIGRGATDTQAGTSLENVANFGEWEHCPGDSGDSFGGGGGGGGYYCGGGGAIVEESGGGGGGSSYGPAGASYSVVTQAPSVTITYQTAFELAPASRSSLALDGAGGYVTQQVPSGSSSQLWQLVPQGSLYQIVNLATGQCLTTWGNAGGQLFLWFCTPMPQNEWQLPPNFGASGNGSLIENPAYNLFMDVFGGSTTAGGAIDAWPYNGGYANQYFLTFPG